MTTEEMARTEHTGLKMMMAFLGGAFAGTLATLFLAPRSGADTRRRISEMAEKGRETAVKIPVAVREARHAASEAFAGALREKH